MITQDEHTARHSQAGACVFPAGSDGVGGLFLCRGALEDEARPWMTQPSTDCACARS